MRKSIACIVMLLVTMAACKKDNPATPANTIDGTWKLTKYFDITNGTVQAEPSTISRSIIMTFSSNGNTVSVSGQTVMNTVYGAYELSDNNKMATVGFGGSKVAEPDWGFRFWDAMNATSSYKIEKGKLYIYFNADSHKMEFERK